MATLSGNDGEVLLSSNAVAEVRDFSVTENAVTADDTAKGDTWETHKVIRNNWSGQVTCWYDNSDTNGQVALTPGASVTLVLRPNGTGASEPEFTGTATVESISTSSSRDGIVEATFNFKGNGALTRQDQS